MQGLFPPSSNVTGVKCSLALRMTSFPTLTLPVKKILSNFPSKRDVFSALPPLTSATYFSSKHSSMIFFMICVVLGEYALGFKITVFPAAKASARGSIVNING